VGHSLLCFFKGVLGFNIISMGLCLVFGFFCSGHGGGNGDECGEFKHFVYFLFFNVLIIF
jgi:hypothetical protein